MTDNSNATHSTTTQVPSGSTLIEFPGVNRNRPAWRKELSERFREIQQRRAREAETESGGPADAEFLEAGVVVRGASHAPAKTSEATKQLGLVPPPPDEPEPNPIVVAALRRIERARQQAAPQHSAHSGRGQAATAAARVVEERPEEVEEAEAGISAEPAKLAGDSEDAEQARVTTNLVVVPAKPSAKTEAAVDSAAEKTTVAASAPATAKQEATPAATAEARDAAAPARATEEAKPQPRHISGVIDEFWLERQGIDLLPKVAGAAELSYDDKAPRTKRLAAGIVDLLAVAFICAPFAAVIELTIGNWGDPRVWGSMAGIVAVILFLYDTCSVALAGRTLGMKLFSLHAVDALTASVPTTWQCARRSLVYMLSLATFGLGILYSLFDAEGRTAHDLLSGTVVVRQ